MMAGQRSGGMGSPLTELERQKKRIEDLEGKVKKLVDTLAFVRGQPVIQGYAGKRFDMNENLNVVSINKLLKPFAVGAACSDLATAIVLLNLIRAGGIANGVYTVE
jgi:hypothetical protein